MNGRVIVAAKAAERGYFCFVDADRDLLWRSALTDITADPVDADDRLVTYDDMHDPPWREGPLGRDIVSICRYAYPDRDRTIFVILSDEGEVGFVGLEEGHYEKIPEAGMRAPDAIGYGMMARIRQIGTRLHACGFGGQIYRRERSGLWCHIDEGVLRPPSFDNMRSLTDIGGIDENDVYILGDAGFVAWFDGERCHKLPVPTDRDLTCLFVENEASIWIGGKWGALLHGNRRDGFVDRSDPDTTNFFTSITKFRDIVYLGTRDGVFFFDGAAILPLSTNLEPPLVGGHLVDAVDDVLWIFGSQDVVRFDGTRWDRYWPAT